MMIPHPIHGYATNQTVASMIAKGTLGPQWLSDEMRKAGNGPLADEIEAITTGKASQ